LVASPAGWPPFWFYILKKIVNIRATGPNPVQQKSGS
jgi:hypothetical protein